MQNGILLLCVVATIFFPGVSSAFLRPVVSVSVGSDRAKVYSTKSITLIAPFQNAYLGNNEYDTEAVVGLFLGAEAVFLQNWAGQLGLSYFQTSSFAENGNLYQFSNPDFNNFTYQYQIQSRRVLLETKVSYAWRKLWHPYVTVGAGEALNKAYAYTEYPITSDAVPMSEPFAAHNTKSFTYEAGVGVDVDVNDHIRVGVGYRFVNLGNASLGVTPLQESTTTIGNTYLYTNEFLVQFSYLG